MHLLFLKENEINVNIPNLYAPVYIHIHDILKLTFRLRDACSVRICRH